MRAANFSGISNKSFLGKVLRFPLKLIPGSTRMRILQGYNKGYYWTVGSGVHGYWLGSYELFKQETLASVAKSGMIAYDVGAHVGFYTLLFARLCGEKGCVYAFEPNPLNIGYLRRHINDNDVKNVILMPTALGNRQGYSFFSDECDTSMGHLSQKECKTTVPIDRIDNMVEAGALRPPDIIKIDTEGAELDILLGAQKTLRQYRPFVLVAIDDHQNEPLVLEFLTSLGYSLRPLNNDRFEIIGIAEA